MKLIQPALESKTFCAKSRLAHIILKRITMYSRGLDYKGDRTRISLHSVLQNYLTEANSLMFVCLFVRTPACKPFAAFNL